MLCMWLYCVMLCCIALVFACIMMHCGCYSQCLHAVLITTDRSIELIIESVDSISRDERDFP